MAESILRKLSTQFDIHFNTVQQLRNGHNLILIAFKALYNQQNDFLSSKLSGINVKNQSFSKSQLNESLVSNQSITTKPGNNVILINTLLKHIKNDKNIHLPNSIKQLTFYNLLEDDQLLCIFIEWMIKNKKLTKILSNQQNQCESTQFQSYPHSGFELGKQQNFESTSSNHFRNIQIQSIKSKENQRFKTEQRQTLQKQENELENLYFASNLKEKLNDSPVNLQPESTDRIVRKGSFKLLKPKAMFSEQLNSDQQPKQLQESNKNYKKPFQIYQPDELKEISMIESSQPNIQQNLNNIQQNFDNEMSQLNDSIDEIVNKKMVNATPSISREQQNYKKTVPKNLSKPPLYRSSIKNKQNLHTQSKALQQRSKKKNFFNFQNQNEELVSNFNQETVKNIEEIQNNKSENYQEIQNKLNQNQINKMVILNNNGKSEQKSILRQQHNFYDTERTNIIQEDDSYNAQEKIQVEQKRLSCNLKQNNFTNSSSLLKLKNHFLQKQLYTLEKQIQSQQFELINDKSNQESNRQNKRLHDNKSAQSLQNSRQKNESFSSTKRASRKISKIQLNQIEDQVKQDIIDWLASIRVIGKASISFNEVLQLFKNGVKFVQLCNHYIGRGRAIPFFNNPKKNAEIHSNFSKVFEHLKSFSNFPQKQLLFAYELFVPYPQQGSIWNLLETIYFLFNKKGIKSYNSKNKDQSQTFQQQSRFSSNEKFKQHCQPIEGLRNSTNYSSNKQFELNNNNGLSEITKQKSSRKQSTFSKPIEFVPFVPQLPQHNDLVQQSQEPEQSQGKNILNINENGVNNNILSEGYKQKYIRRVIDASASKDHNKSSKQFFSLQTPKKQIVSNQEQSFIGDNKSKMLEKTFINRSSSKKILQSQIKKLQTSSHKLNSIRKNSTKKALSKLPKVTLNMQMKVQRIINEQNLGALLNGSSENNEFKEVQLLEDPIRNGTLINILLARLQEQDIKFIKRPQSIEHCRQNYNKVFSLIKNKYGQQLFELFLFVELIEQILKGEKNIFYSVAYQMIQIVGNKKGENCNSANTLKSNTFGNYNNDCQSNYMNTVINKQEIVKLFCQNLIQWVRLLEVTNQLTSALKIRTLDDLYIHVSTSAFLYSLLQNPSVHMVYLDPKSVSEKEANLKKVMVYMIQMKILKRQEFINTHQIALKNSLAIHNLLEKLVQYTLTNQWSYIEKNINTIKKILIKQSPNKKSQQTNKLNHTYNGQLNSGFNQSGMEINTMGNYQQDLQNHALISSNNNIQIVNSQSLLEGKRSLSMQKIKDKLQTKLEKQQFEVQIPWMRKLGFTNCSLTLNNGILLCRLISKLTRTNIKFNQNISHDAQISKPQALANIRKALKLIPGCRVDEIDVYQADERKTLEIYGMIKDRFRTNYEMGKVVNVR